MIKKHKLIFSEEFLLQIRIKIFYIRDRYMQELPVARVGASYSEKYIHKWP